MDLVGGLYTPQFGVDMIDAMDRPRRYSDHFRFADVGIPAMRLTESVEDGERQHNARDTADAIDFNYLRQVARAQFSHHCLYRRQPGATRTTHHFFTRQCREFLSFPGPWPPLLPAMPSPCGRQTAMLLCRSALSVRKKQARW
ncbi:MAG: M28 family peptidase [Chloroflexi bacterium]|nr:M28 family peptidase [Chloroflexota bacterium]